jgi:nitrate reductase gamma subunit
MHPTSPLLHFAENELQLLALSFMAIVYTLKIRWILRFPASTDRQPSANPTVTNGARGARHSLWAAAMPWTMASNRQHPLLYVQFVIFHLGVATSIAMSLAIPYAPKWIAGRTVVLALQILFAGAAAIGILRLIRRATDGYLRAISSPDDYFSLVMLIVWFLFAAAAAPNRPQNTETPLLAFFLLTAFFLLYVPFSKISHYLYYPLARWYLGRTLGHRGVYPLVKGA